MLRSDCCDAPIIWTDICSECKEHCGWTEDEMDEISIQYEKGLIEYQIMKENEDAY